jgi:WhiB family redox-sensing transcriptional regulator
MNPDRSAEYLEATWLDDAACASVRTDVFFPTRGDNDKMRIAKAICAECPVRAECLDYAIRNAEKFGVWGGLSERERRSLRRGHGRKGVSPRRIPKSRRAA